jgi:predicted Zn-dependent protease
MMLADALLRQTRVTGNAGLAIEAEQALTRSLDGDVANYDANRMLATVYLSQHRFREAIIAAEKTRDARPHDPVNYGIIGDGHLELGEHTEAFDAFDRMMTLRPSAGAYARVAYARELQGNVAGAVESMKLAADASAADDP